MQSTQASYTFDHWHPNSVTNPMASHLHKSGATAPRRCACSQMDCWPHHIISKPRKHDASPKGQTDNAATQKVESSVGSWMPGFQPVRETWAQGCVCTGIAGVLGVSSGTLHLILLILLSAVRKFGTTLPRQLPQLYETHPRLPWNKVRTRHTGCRPEIPAE